MSNEKQAATVKDLVEEAKKRIVLLIVCVVGLSYLMSLTSSSVLVNLPAAGLLIIIVRYFSLDFEMKRRALTYKSKPSSTNSALQRKPLEGPQAKTNDWRKKVSSPVVEDAIDQLTRHIVSEWVTDLWYSRITPDKQGPEELVLIINGVLGEISCRSRNINLINLLTRDIIGLICTNLELFRATKTKIEKQKLKSLTIQELDVEIKHVLAAENKLHPALFSPEAEHKVLQHIMDGLISSTFQPEDLQCSLFRYIVRELLACVVIRPVVNLVSPRFINERIESLVISFKKADRGSLKAQVETQLKENGSTKMSSDDFPPFPDPSVKGVELVQFKKDLPKPDAGNGTLGTKDPLLSIDTRSTRSWNSLPEPLKGEARGIQRHRSGGEWGDMLDMISRRKTEALAPEHFDDMWTKGRNYKSKEGANQLAASIARDQSTRIVKSVASGRQKEKGGELKGSFSEKGAAGGHTLLNRNLNTQSHDLDFSYQEEDIMNSDDTESKSNSSYTTEDEDNGNITGLDSPGVKVWDGKNRRNVNHIHHPLESFESRKTRKTSKGNMKRLSKTQSKRKKSRLNSQKGHVWQEVERTSFLLEDGQDILNTNAGYGKYENLSDDSEAELLNRIGSGAAASSCVSTASLPESHNFAASFSNAPIISDSFWKLRCEVLGANIVKSGSRTFAVYSISVTDLNNNSWSIKRRFQHFEELHRRLKEFPEYNLHLPPKHFLSTGLDVFVVQERCILLDKYLKELLQLPTVSGSIEVWDFLSVDSQTYLYSNPLTIVDTLSVDLGDAAHGKKRDNAFPVADNRSPTIQQAKTENDKAASQMMHEHITDGSKLNAKGVLLSPKNPAKEGKAFRHSSSDSDNAVRKNEPLTRNSGKTVKAGNDGFQESSELHDRDGTDPALPREWVPPNLSHPILELVDVIFQLQDGGWIRRKAFWVAKQVLQLGMGDAFDDWLIEKIQLLRRGPIVASGIKRLEQILWPDGIFITKHPRRKQPTPSASPSYNSPHGRPTTPLSSPTSEDMQRLEEIQQKEAERRAKLVYELMIDKAPAAIVSLVGTKEYEQCAKDLYYFIQSSVFMKQLVLDLLQLLFLSAFPELDNVFRQLHEEKERFGELKRES